MQLTISFTANSAKEAQAIMAAVHSAQGAAPKVNGLATDSDDEETSHINVAQLKSKRGRPAKAAKPVEDAEEEFEAETDEDEESEDDFSADESDEDEEAEEAPAPKAKKAKGPTLDDVIEGFKACAKKHGRERTAKILKQFNSKSTRDIASKDYPAVLKLLAK